MAAPIVEEIYPANNDTGIPIGETCYVIFDRGIDLSVAKQHVVLYGPSMDVVSGPDSAQWINEETGANPLFLKSPSMKGVVDCDYELVYVNGAGDTLDPQPDPVSEAAEVLAGYRHKLLIKPKKHLAADATYKLHVIGDPDGVSRGIASKTVFAVTPDGGNTSTTGKVIVYGGYTSGNDKVIVEITTDGDMGDAKYRWYYESLGVGGAVSGKVTSRKFRKLEDGLQIRFEGSGFVTGDLYTVNVEQTEYLASSYTVTFSTNDGMYSEAPASSSVPATSVPPSSVVVPGGTTTEYLELLISEPEDGATNQPLDTTVITLKFSSPLDPATITQDTVKIWAYPISGKYSDTPDRKQLRKKLLVSGDTLTIKI